MSGSARPIRLESGSRPNTLNADQRTLVALAQKLDAESKAPGHVKRNFVRWPFRHASLTVLIQQDRNNRLSLKLACRNLSRGGISLLHAAYVHQGTRLTVNIPALTGEEVQVDGSVVRCIHRGGVVHEIGVKFDAEIDIRRFALPDQSATGFSLERVDASKLTGRVLLVSDSKGDLNLFEHYLADTGAQLHSAAGGEAAIEAIRREAFDLIVSDEDVRCTGAGSGHDPTTIPLLCAARAEGCTTPALILALSRTSPIVRDLQNLPGVMLLLKPVTKDQLTVALGEFLTGISANGAGTFRSTLAAADPASALVVSYVRELHDLAAKLEQGLRGDDAEACTKVCHRIQGSAPTMGFAILGELAEKAAKTISISKSLADSQRTVKELITACERARTAA